MRISPFLKKVTIDDATFYLKISYGAKVAYAKLLKLGEVSGADAEGNATVSLDGMDMGDLVKITVDNNVVQGWDNLQTEFEDNTGELIVKEYPFSLENVRNLPGDLLIEIATQALGLAFNSRGNATSSENK
ncbi:MAG: hypothetical protein HF312_15395 [Ignavibacteria bacterium]|jgi:hypothetical protein|nr:hypothetical protein [Ignavibacteria bacterium]